MPSNDIEKLVKLIYQSELELKKIEVALQDNQKSGERINSEIKNLKATDIKVPSKMNDLIREVTYIREWHIEFVKRLESFLLKSKTIYVEYDKIKDKKGFFVKDKIERIFREVSELVSEGEKLLHNLNQIFLDNYSKLVTGQEVRDTALVLLSNRLGDASKARGDWKLSGWKK